MLAEGMDGLDFQPARRLERLGKESARLAQAFRVRRLGADIRQTLSQLGIREQRPFAQTVEQPRRHLGGRRLGIGEAEDARRRRTREQEPRHPIGQ